MLAELSSAANATHITERVVPLVRENPVWCKARFAAERFLVLADLLERYRKPVLVSDIDVLVVRDPRQLLEPLADFDFGYTTFRDTNEAWERYAATALIVRPTANALAFFWAMARMIEAVLATHGQPWFVDQIALYRLIEEFPSAARGLVLKDILTESPAAPPADAFFELLHGSWQ